LESEIQGYGLEVDRVEEARGYSTQYLYYFYLAQPMVVMPFLSTVWLGEDEDEARGIDILYKESIQYRV